MVLSRGVPDAAALTAVQIRRKLPIRSGRFGSPTSEGDEAFSGRPKGIPIEPALLSHTMDGPGGQPSRRSDTRRERRATKRLNTETIERLVAEYTAGATASFVPASREEAHPEPPFHECVAAVCCCRVPAGAESRIEAYWRCGRCKSAMTCPHRAGHRRTLLVKAVWSPADAIRRSRSRGRKSSRWCA